MNVPHDVETDYPRRMYLRAHAQEDEVSEGAPDYIAGAQEHVDAPATPSVSATLCRLLAPAAQDSNVRTVAVTSKPGSE